MVRLQLTPGTCCSTLRLPVASASSAEYPPIHARYCMISLLVSVFPAPLSPLTCSHTRR
jgi:hypothetical protein